MTGTGACGLAVLVLVVGTGPVTAVPAADTVDRPG